MIQRSASIVRPVVAFLLLLGLFLEAGFTPAAAVGAMAAPSRLARFGVVADGFCYPAGRFDAAAQAEVRAAGFRSATTEQPGVARPGDDRDALPRLRVNAGDSPATVLAAVRASLGSA